MSVVRKLVREPALVTGVVTSGLGLAVLFDVPLSEAQVGGIVLFLGAVMALSRAITTPSADVVAVREPASNAAGAHTVAGPASPLPDGTPVGVTAVGPPPA